MFNTTMSRDIHVSADQAWALLSDWGNTAWIPGPEKTEVITRGEQVTRRLFMPGADPIEETMLSLDPQNKSLKYTIAVSQLFTLENYQGKITVVENGGACRVDWKCTFDLAGLTPEQAQAAADGNLNFLLDSLKAYLEK